jgi:hypothetical protein
MVNGATKGGDAWVFQTIAAAPSHPVVWQLHYATKSPEVNWLAEHIANTDGSEDGGRWMHLCGLTAG